MPDAAAGVAGSVPRVSFYERHLFSRLMDRAMRGPEVGRLRAALLAPACGDVIEIGFGTGLNLAHYPAGVRSLVAVDPLDALRERVAARIAAAPFPVERVGISADGRLPFDDARFDVAVSTFTLCSVPDAVAAVRELRRVTKPGGRFLFLEHGLSDDASTARWQRRVEPLHKRIGAGCHLTRSIDAIVRAGGFEPDVFRRYLLPGPRILSEMYEGGAPRDA